MTKNIPALIAEARKFDTRPAEYAMRLKGAHDLIARLADALESLSAPAATDDERAELGGIIHRTVPDDESLAHLCEDDDCLWYDIADAILAAGFRRPSPLTREALADMLVRCLSDLATGPLSDTPYKYAEVNDEGQLELSEALGDWPQAAIDVPQLADAILSRFAPPATDDEREALIDSLRRKARIFERPEGEGANETYLLLNQAADALSQPVQVEVTNEMVERAARALGEFVTHGGVDDLSGPNGEYWIREARAVLSAALGGGDHAE